MVLSVSIDSSICEIAPEIENIVTIEAAKEMFEEMFLIIICFCFEFDASPWWIFKPTETVLAIWS